MVICVTPIERVWHMWYTAVRKISEDARSWRGPAPAAPSLARAAAAAGADGFFMEVHPEPEKGLSDAENMIALRDVEQMLSELAQIYGLIQSWDNV